MSACKFKVGELWDAENGEIVRILATDGAHADWPVVVENIITGKLMRCTKDAGVLVRKHEPLWEGHIWMAPEGAIWGPDSISPIEEHHWMNDGWRKIRVREVRGDK